MSNTVKSDGTPYVQGDHNWVSGSYPNEFKFWCFWCGEAYEGSECPWRYWASVPADFEAACDNGCCDCRNQKELVQLRCQTGNCEGIKYNVWWNRALGSVLCRSCFQEVIDDRL